MWQLLEGSVYTFPGGLVVSQGSTRISKKCWGVSLALTHFADFWGEVSHCINHFVIWPRISWMENPFESSRRPWECLGHVMDIWGFSLRFCLLITEAISQCGTLMSHRCHFSREISSAANGWLMWHGQSWGQASTWSHRSTGVQLSIELCLGLSTPAPQPSLLRYEWQNWVYLRYKKRFDKWWKGHHNQGSWFIHWLPPCVVMIKF